MVSEDSLAKKNGAKPRKHRERHATLSTIGDWQPAADRAPLELLAEQDRGRVQELLPLRRERMSVSPFTFYRGSAILMASDLASLPVSGIEVQICGDAHIANFGVYASPNATSCSISTTSTKPRPTVEWDVLRMATSVRLAALDRGFRTVADEMVRHSAAAYRQEMDAYAEMSPVDIWYDHLDVREIINGTPKKRREVLERQLARGKKRTGRQLAPRSRPATRRASWINLQPSTAWPRRRRRADALAMLEPIAPRCRTTCEPLRSLRDRGHGL